MKDLRIGYGNSGNALSQNPRDKAAAFRRAHRVGQILHGRLLRWIRGNMALVNVGGQELVAELHAKPESGVPLRFLVVQLLPDILLREIGDEEAARYAAPSRRDSMHAYMTARNTLDALLHDRLWSRHDLRTAHFADLHHVHTLFANFIAEDAEALTLFTEVNRCLLPVNNLLAATNTGFLKYLPWLLPQARAVELLCAQGEHGTMRLTIGAILPGSGRSLIQCLAGSERMAYRLFLERAETAHAAEPLCQQRDALRPASAFPVLCLGCGPLPPGIHDVLSSALPPEAFGGLHVQA